MGKNNNSHSFEIALSAISCAVAVAFLSLGLLSDFLTALGYLIGILALMIPLSKRFYRGGFLAYLGTCILTFILGGSIKYWDLVPFIMFFGLHPLVNALQVKYNVNRWIALAVKAVWFDCTLIAGYYLVFNATLGGEFLPDEVYRAIEQNIYLVIFTAGTAIFVLYDYLIFRLQIMVNQLVYRIRK